MTTWTNDDGLKVRFGTDRATPALGGVVATDDNESELVIKLDYSKFASAGTAKTVLEDTVIPSGALITSAKLFVTTAFTSGGAATLTIGTAQSDGTTIDADGIDASIALSAINAVGKQVSCDGAQIGGSALTANGEVTVTVGTADYTAGEGTLIIRYLRQ